MNKRGQMRIIEAMTACLLMVSGLAASMYFSSVYTATRNVNVEKKCVDIINLISKHEVTEEIILHKKSWRTNLKSLIESLLPPNVFYRITIRSSLNNTVVGVVTNIKNGSPLNEEPVSIKTSVTISVPLRIRKRVPIDIFFVMDVSASMLRTLPGDKVTKLESAKLAAKSFLDYLNSSRDRVGVISFCSVVTLECNLTSYFGSVREGIDGLRAWGLTNIGDGIYRATSEFNVNGRGDALLVIIVLSDGKANLPVNEDYARDYALNASQEASERGIKIYTIGFGSKSDLDEDLLTEMASNGGKYYYAPSSNDLINIYSTIAQDLVFTIRYDVLTIELTILRMKQ